MDNKNIFLFNNIYQSAITNLIFCFLELPELCYLLVLVWSIYFWHVKESETPPFLVWKLEVQQHNSSSRRAAWSWGTQCPGRVCRTWRRGHWGSWRALLDHTWWTGLQMWFRLEWGQVELENFRRDADQMHSASIQFHWWVLRSS